MKRKKGIHEQTPNYHTDRHEKTVSHVEDRSKLVYTEEKTVDWQMVASFYGHQSFSGAPVKWSTIDSRAFPKTWNTLPEDVTSSQSEYTFRR